MSSRSAQLAAELAVVSGYAEALARELAQRGILAEPGGSPEREGTCQGEPEENECSDLITSETENVGRLSRLQEMARGRLRTLRRKRTRGTT